MTELYANRFERSVIDAAKEQRAAYDRWKLENDKDVGESLAAYGAATDKCLLATAELLIHEESEASGKTSRKKAKL